MEIITEYFLLEELFSSFESILGNDLHKYKNHVYRIFNYAAFLKEEQELEKFAIASFFHDVGIWTHHTFDYLAPSAQLAKDFLADRNSTIDPEEIALMIDNHHKVSSYKGKFEEHVEIFRKADWTDVTMGAHHFEIPSSFIRKVEKQFPYKAFHFKLVKLFSGNFLKHPTSPLPMFKK